MLHDILKLTETVLRDSRLGIQINLDGLLMPAPAQLMLHASVTFLSKW